MTINDFEAGLKISTQMIGLLAELKQSSLSHDSSVPVSPLEWERFVKDFSFMPGSLSDKLKYAFREFAKRDGKIDVLEDMTLEKINQGVESISMQTGI